MKLYSALYDEFYPFNKMFPEWECEAVGPKDTLTGPGALIIWGGSDIHPDFYQRPNIKTYTGERPSSRDTAEADLFAQAVQIGLLIIGVCRGAQLGCALSGGILIQDVGGHHIDHHMTTVDGLTLLTSSIHHQMMYPWEIDHELIAWSAPARSKEYTGITEAEVRAYPKNPNDGKYIEPEIVWFPQTKCLGIQGHPEMMHEKCKFNNYIKTLIEKYGADANG